MLQTHRHQRDFLRSISQGGRQGRIELFPLWLPSLEFFASSVKTELINDYRLSVVSPTTIFKDYANTIRTWPL